MTPESTSLDTTSTDFVVHRQDFSQHKFVSAPTADPAPGQVLIRVDRFAFTANNITYAVLGDMLQYWNFFPAEKDWGIIPVWGFGEIVHSNHDGLTEGERIYGYFPMSTHVLVQPDRVEGASFIDASPHRSALNMIYNQYFRCQLDRTYDPNTEDLQALFRPLFTTSFLIDDFLHDNNFFGAEAVVLSSASSKTAYGAAYALHRHRGDRSPYEVVGLTSPGNVDFVEQLGFYDRVLTYDAVSSLARETPVVYVDMAGNSKLRSELHHHYRDSMKYSCQVGLSHWSQAAPSENLPGPEPQTFFAPTQMQKRLQEAGAKAFREQLGAAWLGFRATAEKTVEIVTARGQQAIAKVYLEMLQGRVNPNQGQILSLWE